MNIFVLDEDPVRAAQAQCDRHVVKMPLESAQMVCTIARAHGIEAPYRPTHAKHPCTVWAGASQESFQWLLIHAAALCAEYTRRYGKVHACEAVLRDVGARTLFELPRAARPDFVQTMPEQYRRSDAVSAYRAFYLGDKVRFATWRGVDPPAWWLSAANR